AGGLTLTYWTGSPLWDGVASGLIGLVLIAVAVILSFETYSLLIGEAAPEHVQRRIRNIVDRHADVQRLVDLQTLHIGPQSLVVALGIHFRRGLETRDVEVAVACLEPDIQLA